MMNKVYIVRIEGNEDWLDACVSFKDVVNSIQELLEEDDILLDSEAKENLLHIMAAREAKGYVELLPEDALPEEAYTAIFVQAAPLRGV